MRFFRSVGYEIKWILEELIILAKHPTRKATYHSISYHWYKLWDTIIFHPWYCLKRGIKNIFRWFPIIWRNDSWDYFFLCDMMDKQLKDMEHLWETMYVKEERKWEAQPNGGCEKGFRCQHRRILKRIRWTRKLMNMWREEYYAIKWYDYHHSKFPERGLFASDEVAKYDEYGVPVLYTCKPMPEDEREHYRSGSDKAREMDEKVFKLWQKNLGFIRNWWH